MRRMERKKITLFQNTAWLYLMTFSSYILSFIAVPYETRVLEPRLFGAIGLATAVMVYFRLVLDFGFLSSATAEISANRDDRRKVSEIFSSIVIIKLILSVLAFGVLWLIFSFVEQWKQYTTLFVLFFLEAVVSTLIPDYLYRGIEKMSTITIRTVLIRLFFTGMVFLVVKEPSDYLWIPGLQLIGAVVALICVYIHLHFGLKFRLVRTSPRHIWTQFKSSVGFFFSRIATTAYTSANTIILDLISAGTMTAFYTSANQLVSTAKTGIYPISDSLYPYMIKNRDFRLVKKMMLLLEPIVLVGCVIVFIWADPLCAWFFGEEYAYTGTVLRTLLPVIAMALPSCVFGFPVLGAMGLNKYVNYSVIWGSVLHVVGLVVLFALGSLSVITLGIMTSITEGFILVYRLTVVFKYKKRLGREYTEVL